MEELKRFSLTNLADPIVDNDVFVVATFLKRYFYELPEPLLMFKLYTRWLEVAAITDVALRVSYLRTLAALLDEVHFNVLRYMCEFFSDLIKKSGLLLSETSVAQEFGPLFLRAPEKEPTQKTNLPQAVLQDDPHAVVVSTLIAHHQDIFSVCFVS